MKIATSTLALIAGIQCTLAAPVPSEGSASDLQKRQWDWSNSWADSYNYDYSYQNYDYDYYNYDYDRYNNWGYDRRSGYDYGYNNRWGNRFDNRWAGRPGGWSTWW